LIPGLGVLLEKSGFCVTGDVPKLAIDSTWDYIKRRFKNTSLNTFDGYGSHQYQHHKSDDEMRAMVKSMQSDESKVLNMEKYFQRTPPIGCALRVLK